MRTFNGNIQNFENAVIEDYIDPFSIPDLKILVSKGRDRIEIQNKPNTNLRNHTNLGDGSGGNYIQTQGLPKLLKSQGFKVGTAGVGGGNVNFSRDFFIGQTRVGIVLHFKTPSSFNTNQRILKIQESGNQGAFGVDIQVGENVSSPDILVTISGDQGANVYNSFSFISEIDTEYTFVISIDADGGGSANYKLHINGIEQVSILLAGVGGMIAYTNIHQFNSSIGSSDVIVGNYLFAKNSFTDVQMKQLYNKILNLGYL